MKTGIKISSGLAVAALVLPHLFCCVLPAVLAALSLIAPAGDAAHIIPHEWEIWLFAFSGLMLGVSWFLVLRRCRCDCTDCARPPRHRVMKIILYIATILFAASLIFNIFSHH